MLWRWLIDRPVIHWRVFNWNINICTFLYKIVINSINDNISQSKIFTTSHAFTMRWWWLVNWPVIHWRVFNWIFNISTLLNEVIVNSINNNISLSKVFISSHSFSMWWWWLVNWPVVHWRVFYWVTDLGKTNGNWRWLVSH